MLKYICTVALLLCCASCLPWRCVFRGWWPDYVFRSPLCVNVCVGEYVARHIHIPDGRPVWLEHITQC
jgi:hypothetical protein